MIVEEIDDPRFGAVAKLDLGSIDLPQIIRGVSLESTPRPR
jgi:hypothetical protein